MKKLTILGLGLLVLVGLPACEKEVKVSEEPSKVASITCPAAVFTGTAISGVTYNGVFTVPYTGGDGSSYTTDSGVSSLGVTGLSAVLVPGTLETGDGMLTYAVAGTPSSGGMAAFVISFSGQSCTVSMPVMGAPENPEPVGG